MTSEENPLEESKIEEEIQEPEEQTEDNEVHSLSTIPEENENDVILALLENQSVESEQKQTEEENTDAVEETLEVLEDLLEDEGETEAKSSSDEEAETEPSEVKSVPESTDILEPDKRETIMEDVLNFASSYASTQMSELPPPLEELFFEESEASEFDQIDRDLYYGLYDEFTKKIHEEKRKNQYYNRKVVDYYKKRKMLHVLQESFATVDSRRKTYVDHLERLADLDEKQEQEKIVVNEEIASLRNKCEDRRKEAELAFGNFQKGEVEVAKQWEHLETPGLTGRIERYLKRQKIQLAQIVKMRLDYTKLKNRFNEKEEALDSLDNLGPGIRLVDYEQLKLDNRNLHDKVEEKEAELGKVREKCQNTAQTLAHVREKLHTCNEDIDELMNRFEQIDEEYTDAREQIGFMKQERDARRLAIVKMKSKTGFMNKPKLMADMRSSKAQLQELGEEVYNCKRDYFNIDTTVKRMRAVANSPRKMDRLKAKLDGKKVKTIFRSEESDFQFKFT